MKKTNDIANEDKKFFKEYNAEKHVGLTGASLYTLDESETDDFIKWRKANHPTKEEVQSLKESNAALILALDNILGDVLNLLDKNKVGLGTVGAIHIVQAKQALNKAKNI